MRIFFRADASVEIGSGHIVRCATLASRLAAAGHQVGFICREMPGSLGGWLETQGFEVINLAPLSDSNADEEADAADCRKRLAERPCDWLIVDHYGLGTIWEKAAAGATGRMLAIDDLGRAHECDVVLDQNYANPTHALYPGLVPPRCDVLLGPTYALVGPKFRALRAASLGRQRDAIARLLVFMGGSDPSGETTKVLEGIRLIQRPELQVDVVIGAGNPRRDAIAIVCGTLPNAALHVQTTRMAELMAAADCTIGGSGGSVWERCVLGLPALVTILADNQAPIAEAVHRAGGHWLLGWHHVVTAEDYAGALVSLEPAALARLSEAASRICDGNGVDRVAGHMTGCWGSRRRAGGFDV